MPAIWKPKELNGLDLLTYRYTGDAPRLLQEVVKSSGVPMVSAGSIDSYDRIAKVRDTGAWGFTIGTAFFEKKFIPDGSLPVPPFLSASMSLVQNSRFG